MGICLETLELEAFSTHEFCIMMSVKDKRSNFRWQIVTVYGPAKHEPSRFSLEELGEICKMSSLPVIIGVDFDLIRYEADKSTENYDYGLMEMFNAFIGDNQLRELKRSGQRFS